MPRDTIDLPVMGRAAEIRAVSTGEAERTIDIVWTTGAIVRRRRWDGWDELVEYDEELVVSPDAIRMDRLNAGAPFLDSHSGWSLSSVLGSVVPGSAVIEGGEGRSQVRLTAAEDARDAVLRILEKSVRFVSVGYIVHKYEITKEDGKRELWRAVDWEPFEISAVAMPADPGAHVRGAEGSDPARPALNPCVLIRQDIPAANAVTSMERTMTDTPTTAATTDAARTAAVPPVVLTITAAAPDPVAAERQRATDINALCARHAMPDLAADMIGQGVSLDAARATVLERLAQQDAAAGARTAPTVTGRGQDETEVRRRGMEEALLASVLRREPEEIGRQYRGLDLIELAAERLGERRVPRGFGDREALLMRAHSTSDFPFLLENVLNKSLGVVYAKAEPTYRKIARQRTYMDFRAHPTIRPGDFPKLQTVSPENGEIKGGTATEAKEATQVTAYGVQITFSRQLLVNDSLGGLQRVIDDQGPSVARYEEEVFYTMLLTASGAGPTLLETTRAVFNTTDLTLAGAGAAISTTSIGAGRAVMMGQTSKSGAKLNVMPSILLCGPAKITEAETVLVPVQAAQASQVNLFAGRVSPLASAWIPGNAWYLFADPSVLPSFEWGLLEGYTAPRFRMEEPFGVQGTRMSLEHDFGCGAIDFRGSYRNPGA